MITLLSVLLLTNSWPPLSSAPCPEVGGGLRDAGWMRENMSQNRLAILPGLTHYETGAAPAMVRPVLPFLTGESGAASWSEQVKRTA